MKTKIKLPEAEIPTASMADVAFLLIVFFMITLSLATGQGLDFKPAQDDPNVTLIDPVESILVEIRSDSSLVVDGTSMTSLGMLEYLAPKLQANPKKPVILRPSGDAPYGSMVEVFDTLRSAKQRLGLQEDIQIALPSEREIAHVWG